MFTRISALFLVLCLFACGPIIDEQAAKQTLRPDLVRMENLEKSFPETIGVKVIRIKKGTGNGEVVTASLEAQLDFVAAKPYFTLTEQKPVLSDYIALCAKFFEDHKDYLDTIAPLLRIYYDKPKAVAQAQIDKAQNLTPEQIAALATEGDALNQLEQNMSASGVEFLFVKKELGDGTQNFTFTLTPETHFTPDQKTKMEAFSTAAKNLEATYGADLAFNDVLKEKIRLVDEALARREEAPEETFYN